MAVSKHEIDYSLGKSSSSIIGIVESGDFSDGLTTTVLPATKSAARGKVVMATRKFHGTISARDPVGFPAARSPCWHLSIHGGRWFSGLAGTLDECLRQESPLLAGRPARCDSNYQRTADCLKP